MASTKTIVLFLASFLLLSPSSSAFDYNLHQSGSEPEFSYKEDTGRGPSKGALNPGWRACGNGKSQSPIDLADQNVRISYSLGQLQTSYKPAPATIKNRGHDITITWKGDAGTINIGGSKYQLEQSHWHESTEHAINGRRADLEFHMRHTNPNGAGAVIAFLYQIGQADAFLSMLLPSIKSVTKEEQDIGIINPGEAGSFSGNYYRYTGSLSTPPCTEGVVWTVFQEMRTASLEQLQALRDAVDEGFEMNARPIQALNGRTINLYQP